MSSGSEEEREQEACKWWGQGEGDSFFRVGKEKLKKTSRKEEEKQIILKRGREGGQKDGDNYVITGHKPSQKVYNKFMFLSAWVWIDFFPPLRL